MLHARAIYAEVYSRHLVINVQSFLCSQSFAHCTCIEMPGLGVSKYKNRLSEEVCSTGFHLQSSLFKDPPSDFKPGYLIRLPSYLYCCFKPRLSSN